MLAIFRKSLYSLMMLLLVPLIMTFSQFTIETLVPCSSIFATFEASLPATSPVPSTMTSVGVAFVATPAPAAAVGVPAFAGAGAVAAAASSVTAVWDTSVSSAKQDHPPPGRDPLDHVLL